MPYIINICAPVIISITTGCYQAGGAKEEKVAQRFHPRGEHLVGALGVGVYALPQAQPATAVSNTILHMIHHVTVM